MKRGEHQIRVVVEIRGDGYSCSIPAAWKDLPPHLTLESAAKFSLQNCLESEALRGWKSIAAKHVKD